MAKRSTRELAEWIVRRLRQAGFQALLAGGCVRDRLLGLEPTDYDVATDATPEQVQRLFRRVLMVGAQFGVAVVVRRGQTVEVATFRSDVSYSDGRRPDRVVYADARADALRRDFTINGMFLDPLTDDVLDFVGGREDLAAGVVRAIGNPEERFREDHLRTLRAVRFAARFGFAVEPRTAAAVARNADGLRRISGERIRDELEKILARPGAHGAMAMAADLGLTPHAFSERVVEPATWTAGMGRLERVARHRDPALCLAALLAGAGVPEIRRLARHWGASNALRDTLAWLAANLPRWREGPTMPLPDLKRLLAHRDRRRLLRLWRAEERRVEGREAIGRATLRRVRAIPRERIDPPPLVTGEDLKAMGLREGPALGQLLRALRELQLDEKLHTREEAMAEARRRLEA